MTRSRKRSALGTGRITRLRIAGPMIGAAVATTSTMPTTAAQPPVTALLPPIVSSAAVSRPVAGQ